MTGETDLERRLDELLDESLQTILETKKLALKEKIKQIYEELNCNDRHGEKDPFCFDDHCDLAAISCVELTMRRNKSGYFVDWMEGEPTSDDWSGLTDNQMMILEDKEPERRAKYLSIL